MYIIIITNAITNITTGQTTIILVQIIFSSGSVGYNSIFPWELIKSSKTRCKPRYSLISCSCLSLEEQMLCTMDIHNLVKCEQMPSKFLGQYTFQQINCFMNRYLVCSVQALHKCKCFLEIKKSGIQNPNGQWIDT